MNYVDQIAAAIQAQYPSLTEVIGIGRQNEEGVIVIGSETYGGISDKRDNYAYIRYRGREDWRHSRATRQISSTPTMEATAELRLVVVHREQNTAAFVEGLAGVLMGVFKNIGGVHIQVVSTDQDRNRILREESKTDNGQWNMAVGLARVDFTLTYTYTGQPCNPADLCGGGTIPTPTDCPTLCDQITVATAQQVVDCFDSVKEAAVAVLICDPCPPCDPATYTNGAAFTVEIAAGETYTAPEIEVTDVDGSTRNSVANVGVVCEWKELTGVDSAGDPVSGSTISSYPAGGEYVFPDQRINDAGVNQFALPYRNKTFITNANLALAVNDTPAENTHNLTIEVDVPVVNSDGVAVGSNVDDLLNAHVLPDINITDDDGAVATIAAPTLIVIDGVVDTATQDPATGIVTITPAGAAPTALIYQRSGFRGFQDSIVNGDLGWQVANGTYNYGNGVGTRVSYGSGADRFYRVAPLNAFGNSFRYTDTVGGGASDNLADWATVDWSLRPTAIPYYVIDHLTGNGWIVVKIGFQQTWDAALATCNGLNYGGFSDYRMPSTGEVEDVLNTANTAEYFGSGNIFFRSSFFVAGTDTSMWLNSYNIANNTQANTLNNSGDIGRAARTATTSRATYAVRTHYPAV